ncbi:hypothetical protein FQN54_007120 [Arachnomyces sp. PD_36]|nr:hypothetical protein FQN54_007120 [Arachnomyces sp. PD_36]
MAEVYVAIERCADEDVPHWCLYTMDDEGNEVTFEALGTLGEDFHFNSQPVHDLTHSESIAATPRIGRIEADVWPDVPGFLRQLPMGDLREVGWNCQNWVLEAIAALKRIGYLEEDGEGMGYLQPRYQKKWRDARGMF